VSVLVRELFRAPLWSRPNLDEAALCWGVPSHAGGFDQAARRAAGPSGAKAVLLRRALASGNIVVDVLVHAGDGWHWFESPRVVTASARHRLHAGVGHRAQLRSASRLLQAVHRRATMVWPRFNPGRRADRARTWPLNHGHAPKPMVRKPNLSAR